MARNDTQRIARRDTSLSSYLDDIGRTPLLSAAEEVELAQQIDAGRAAEAQLEKAGLPADLKSSLRRTAASGLRARDRFLEANLRLVVSVARRYQGHGVDFGDLIQEGNLGLVRAVEKYDWRKGFKFSTYATWWIRQAVAKAILQKGRAIRLPARIHDAAIALSSFSERFLAERGRGPTLDEAAEGTGIKRSLVEEVMRSESVTSLDNPVGVDGAVIADFVTLVDEEASDSAALAEAVTDDLLRAISRLPERERFILIKRYGFADAEPCSLAEIGGMLGVTANRVGQIEKRALCRLRHPAFGLRESDLV